jgi:hypothetical protein
LDAAVRFNAQRAKTAGGMHRGESADFSRALVGRD